MDSKIVKVILPPELLSGGDGDIIINIVYGEGKAPKTSIEASRPHQKATQGEGTDFLSYMTRAALQKKAEGKARTSETYTATISRFRKFLNDRGKESLPVCEMTKELVSQFGEYLKSKGLSMNTQSFYLRILRCVCNRASREGLMWAAGLFNDVYTGMPKTNKRAISMADIHLIATTNMASEREAFARDLFLFSFYTRGMSMIDIAHLRPQDIRNGMLTYQRRKTGRALSMEWLPEMQHIVDIYKYGRAGHLFPIITLEGDAGRQQYKRMQFSVNHALKQIGRRIGLRQPLTMYVARHSWASIAKANDVPTAVISDAMGHSSEKVTQIYLDSISANRIDDVNRKIVQMVGA